MSDAAAIVRQCWPVTGYDKDEWMTLVDAIEQEAVAALLAEVEREVEGCRGGSPDRNDTVDDVLAIIREVRER